VLLHALEQLALDPVAVGIGSQDETLPSDAQLRDIVAQQSSVSRSASACRASSVIDLLVGDSWKLSVIAPAASSGPAPHCEEKAAPRRTRVPPP
jgi:hypothetical protein